MTKKEQATEHAEFLRDFIARIWTGEIGNRGTPEDADYLRLEDIATFLTPAPSKSAVDSRSKPWDYLLRLWSLKDPEVPEMLGESGGTVLTTGQIPEVIVAEMSEFFEVDPTMLPVDLTLRKLQQRLPQIRTNLVKGPTTVRIEFEAGGPFRLEMEVRRPVEAIAEPTA